MKKYKNYVLSVFPNAKWSDASRIVSTDILDVILDFDTLGEEDFGFILKRNLEEYEDILLHPLSYFSINEEDAWKVASETALIFNLVKKCLSISPEIEEYFDGDRCVSLIILNKRILGMGESREDAWKEALGSLMGLTPST